MDKRKDMPLDSGEIVRGLSGAACCSAVVAVGCALACVGGADGILSGVREGAVLAAKSVPYSFGGCLAVVGVFRATVPWRGFSLRGLALPLIGLLVMGVSVVAGMNDAVEMNRCYIIGYRDGKRGRPMVDVRKSEKVYPRVMDALLTQQRESGGAE